MYVAYILTVLISVVQKNFEFFVVPVLLRPLCLQYTLYFT